MGSGSKNKQKNKIMRWRSVAGVGCKVQDGGSRGRSRTPYE